MGNIRLDELWYYYPTNDTWIQVGNGPVQRMGHGAVWDPINHRMIIIGGEAQGGTIQNDSLAFYPSTNTWATVQSIPDTGVSFVRAAYNPIESKVQVILGNGSGGLDRFWLFDVKLNLWSAGPQDSFSHYAPSVACDLSDGALLVHGGKDSGNGNLYYNDTWAYMAMNTSLQFLTLGLTWQPEGIRLNSTPQVPEFKYPEVIKLDNGSYRMFYTMGKPVVEEIGSAFSLDGINWVEEPGSRITSSAYEPKVIRLDNGSYRMYYQTNNPSKIVSAISSDSFN